MKTDKKRLLVDLSKLQGAYCGLWEVSRQLGQVLIDNVDHDRWELTFLVPRNHSFTDSRVRYLCIGWWHRFFLRCWHYDVLHGLAQNTPYLRYKNSRSKYVITLHDLNFLHEKSNVNYQNRCRRKYQRNLQGVNQVVFISRFTEQDALAHLNFEGIKTSVIYNGVAERNVNVSLCPPLGFEAQLQGRDFLLTISTIMRKKNIHLLVDMMKHLPHFCLVIAGRVIHCDYFAELVEAIEKHKLSNRVFMQGPVDDAEKFWLYNSCKAFVFPSQAEGFGIPPIEAMRAGKPVFASRSTSIPEVCGDMAFYWDTLSGAEMAEVVKRSLSDKNAPQNNPTLLMNYAKKYSWDTCAQEYIKIYEELTQ